MQEQFANYQIGVDILNGLPKECCEVTVKLNEEFASIQGWKKKVFICRSKDIVNGKVMKPVHETGVELAVYEWDHPEKKTIEIQLNSLLIKLFRIQ